MYYSGSLWIEKIKRKVFKRINNQMIIERVINQLKKSKKNTNILVATSKYKQDDDIEKFCLSKLNFSEEV